MRYFMIGFEKEAGTLGKKICSALDNLTLHFPNDIHEINNIKTIIGNAEDLGDVGLRHSGYKRGLNYLKSKWKPLIDEAKSRKIYKGDGG